MSIRPVLSSDIALLSEFWYDQMALRLQKQSSVRFSAHAQEEWQDYARQMMTTNAIFLVAESENGITGCVIGSVSRNRVGLLPRQFGVIESLIIDLHSPHRQRILVNELLQAVRSEFFQRGLSYITVSVPTYAPVEQAFWRAQGLKQVEDTFWIEL